MSTAMQRALEKNPSKSDLWVLLGRAWVQKARDHLTKSIDPCRCGTTMLDNAFEVQQLTGLAVR